VGHVAPRYASDAAAPPAGGSAEGLNLHGKNRALDGLGSYLVNAMEGSVCELVSVAVAVGVLRMKGSGRGALLFAASVSVSASAWAWACRES